MYVVLAILYFTLPPFVLFHAIQGRVHVIQVMSVVICGTCKYHKHMTV